MTFWNSCLLCQGHNTRDVGKLFSWGLNRVSHEWELGLLISLLCISETQGPQCCGYPGERISCKDQGLYWSGKYYLMIQSWNRVPTNRTKVRNSSTLAVGVFDIFQSNISNLILINKMHIIFEHTWNIYQNNSQHRL